MGKTVEIMFDDLIESKKKEVLKEFQIGGPEEMNWDIVPIAVIEMEMEIEIETETNKG